jgi:5-(carboxyamino)imidazole ribonucleotide synthase
VILPGAVLGVLGGGQLGRMFTVRAREMGYRVIVLDPDLNSPAGGIADQHVAAEYHDEIALREMAERCSAITIEFENIPADVLTWLADRVPVRPGPEAVAIAQDRIVEKTYLRQHGLPTAAFATVDSAADLDGAWSAVGAPALLKTARLGYDGKGQAGVEDAEQLPEAYSGLRSNHCVLERRLVLEGELSVVLTRGVDGEVASFPVVENVHVNGILDTSTVPARFSPEVGEAAAELAVELANQLDYVGVLAVELFVADGGQLFVNEIAPRPHNSGHFTLDACVTDQFEQQVRSLCELPLGEPRLISPVTMINILGDLWSDGDPAWEEALSLNGVKLHLYGKRHALPGRKMGHLNCLAGTPEASFKLAHRAHEALKSRQVAART